MNNKRPVSTRRMGSKGAKSNEQKKKEPKNLLQAHILWVSLVSAESANSFSEREFMAIKTEISIVLGKMCVT